jgi:hypothetical protein
MENDGRVIDGRAVIVVYSAQPVIDSEMAQQFKHRFSNEPEHQGGYATIPIDHPEARAMADNHGCNLWVLLWTAERDSKCLSLKHCAILHDVKDCTRNGFLVSSQLACPKRESQTLRAVAGSQAKKEPTAKKAQVRGLFKSPLVTVCLQQLTYAAMISHHAFFGSILPTRV